MVEFKDLTKEQVEDKKERIEVDIKNLRKSITMFNKIIDNAGEINLSDSEIDELEDLKRDYIKDLNSVLKYKDRLNGLIVDKEEGK